MSSLQRKEFGGKMIQLGDHVRSGAMVQRWSRGHFPWWGDEIGRVFSRSMLKREGTRFRPSTTHLETGGGTPIAGRDHLPTLPMSTGDVGSMRMRSSRDESRERNRGKWKVGPRGCGSL